VGLLKPMPGPEPRFLIGSAAIVGLRRSRFSSANSCSLCAANLGLVQSTVNIAGPD